VRPAVIAPPVAVFVDGRPVAAPMPALVAGGIVSAPLLPYGALIATRVVIDAQRGIVTFERGSMRVTINVPFLRDGAGRIPLGLVARELGDAVAYDAASRTLWISTPPAPLATMTPYAAWTPPPGPLPTFTPEAESTPKPALSGIPHPRRTPVVVMNPPAQ
jgi:hypothetical protein